MQFIKVIIMNIIILYLVNPKEKLLCHDDLLYLNFIFMNIFILICKSHTGIYFFMVFNKTKNYIYTLAKYLCTTILNIVL